MKVAVTSQGLALSSELDPRFGRARYFIVVDIGSGKTTANDNASNRESAQGAGVQAAQKVINLGVEAVITGSIGPKAAATLEAGNIRVHKQNWGTVREAIERFKSTSLP